MEELLAINFTETIGTKKERTVREGKVNLFSVLAPLSPRIDGVIFGGVSFSVFLPFLFLILTRKRVLGASESN